MKIALIQICSVLDYKINLKKIDKMIERAKKEASGLEAVFLPEVFYSMSDGTAPTPYLIEEENEHFKNIQSIAIKHQVCVLGGTAATKVGAKIVNRSYNFLSNGELLSFYDKIHLFKIDLKGSENKVVINEGDVYTAGKDLKTFSLNGFKFGLSICFDLRFPELYREYQKQSVDIITVSSAFTKTTGQAHWKTLVTARAIENQCYMIACNQWGKHNDKLESYGHSLVVDPWGEVIAEAGDQEEVIIATLDQSVLAKVKGRMSIGRQLS